MEVWREEKGGGSLTEKVLCKWKRAVCDFIELIGNFKREMCLSAAPEKCP
ncbi:MAG: hypothetical protein OXU51_26100 [Candidatus Poribacteria bacterium]|nr:hypothetical protein [Candidatus Poribacteria bacterium]